MKKTVIEYERSITSGFDALAAIKQLSSLYLTEGGMQKTQRDIALLIHAAVNLEAVQAALMTMVEKEDINPDGSMMRLLQAWCNTYKLDVSHYIPTRLKEIRPALAEQPSSTDIFTAAAAAAAAAAVSYKPLAAAEPPTSGASFDRLIRVLIVGDKDVGKSSLIRLAAGEEFKAGHTSHDVDFKGVDHLLGESKVKLYLYDGESSKYPRTYPVVILAFDLTESESFDWVKEELAKLAKDVVKIVVGCKNDLVSRRMVTPEQIDVVCNSYGIPYMETSAKTGLNVNLLTKAVSAMWLEKMGLTRVEREEK